MIDERDFDLFLRELEDMGYEIGLAYISPQYGDAEIQVLRNGVGDPDEWEWDIKDLARDYFEDIDVTSLDSQQLTAMIYG